MAFWKVQDVSQDWEPWGTWGVPMPMFTRPLEVRQDETY